MIKELKEMSLNLKDPVTEQCEELWHMYQPIVLKLCEYKLQSAPPPSLRTAFRRCLRICWHIYARAIR